MVAAERRRTPSRRAGAEAGQAGRVRAGNGPWRGQRQALYYRRGGHWRVSPVQLPAARGRHVLRVAEVVALLLPGHDATGRCGVEELAVRIRGQRPGLEARASEGEAGPAAQERWAP